MNWYKAATFDILDLNDRSIVNNNIRFFETTRKYLNKLAKLVFQNSRLAKSINITLINHKKISSCPRIKELLIASDKIALDSPWRFAAFCKLAVDEIDYKLEGFKKDVHDYTEKKLPKKMKGFFDG
jgi:hypothetical protein